MVSPPGTGVSVAVTPCSYLDLRTEVSRSFTTPTGPSGLAPGPEQLVGRPAGNVRRKVLNRSAHEFVQALDGARGARGPELGAIEEQTEPDQHSQQEHRNTADALNRADDEREDV
jgi:hypothetical protein